MSYLASNLSKHAKWFARFLVEQWDLDPSLGSFRIIDASGGKTNDLILSHDRLDDPLLPEPFHDPNVKFSVVNELISCGFIRMNSGKLGVLTPQLRTAVEANFLPPHQPFLTKRLRPITKKVARILSWHLLAESIPDYFSYVFIPVNGGASSVFLEDSNRNAISIDLLESGENPLLTPDVLRDLQSVGLVALEPTSDDDNSYLATIWPEIHDAVASNFELASKNSSMHVNHMYVTVDRAEISGLASSPEELAIAISERLLPFLQANAGLDRLELQIIQNQLSEIKNAVSEQAAKSALDRFWTTLGRTADIGQILATIVTLIP